MDDGNGEDAFLQRLNELLAPDDTVVDVGCGHGELSISLAKRCRRVVAIDRDGNYMGLAKELAVEAEVNNVEFIAVDLNGSDQSSLMPLDKSSVDLVVDRRGPVLAKWLATLRPLAKPNARALILHPAGGPPTPPWAEELPESLRPSSLGYDEVVSWVLPALTDAGITNYSVEWFDVAERFSKPRNLYDRLKQEDSPPFEEVEAVLKAAFDAQGDNGVSLRHERLLAEFEFPGELP